MSAPGFQERGTQAAAALFAEAVAKTGLLTMQDVIARAGVAYKTVSKHHRAGLLKGERRLVCGKLIWMFESAEVARYAQTARQKANESRRAGSLRGGSARATSADGFVTAAEIASESGRSLWCVYDALAAGQLAGCRQGKKGAYLVPKEAALEWIATYRYLPLGTGYATIPEAARAAGISEGTVRLAIKHGRLTAHNFADVRTQKSPGEHVGRALSRHHS